MTSKHTALLTSLLVLAGATSARADAGRVGTMVDIGVPDGVNGSLVVRPKRWINLHVGAGHNTISPGVRAGATLFLLPFQVSPSISIEAGRYFDGDANTAMVRLGLADESNNPLLREVGYDYANLHTGLDFGRGRFTFYIHGGLSVLRGTIRNLDESIEMDAAEMSDPDAGDGIVVDVRQDPTMTLVTPSARLGMILFF